MKRILLAGMIGAATLGSAFAQTTTTTTVTTIEQPQVEAIRTYITKQPAPTVAPVTGVTYTIGQPLPEPVPLYRLPDDVGVSGYQYTMIDGRTVLVDGNRTVVQVLD
ncbi:DUF1236 domain-containing protein [Aurantimonas sp. Leaf443]|uniref:DUF1236 domain-containing protein n=1 Tax=Aurantimonas sp. Leaf443 TaxID=1736378 RepID=UPI0006F29329|nr:DUF1236 domain-containing protein [Aurantimonas sp. Leaf443]KQT83500.1 hypothetical protein ASG48_13205 [Aurantimonas sp. Leaf443]